MSSILSLGSLAVFAPPVPLLTLPPSPDLTVSIALCAAEASSARFFLNDVQIHIDDGNGQWFGPAPNSGHLSVQGLDQGAFQIAVSNNGTPFEPLVRLPLLGDTTATQAVLFSPPFLPTPVAQPSFPNYTLDLTLPNDPPTMPNMTLLIAPTSAQLSSLPQTACALLNASSSAGSIVSTDPWLRDTEGWRSQWLVDGLSPSTNYTAYVIQDALKVSGPIYFSTKSGKCFPLFPAFSDARLAEFPCPLVHSLPYCPSTAYAVPLPPLPSPTFGYNGSSLPDTISAPLLQYMSNFTTMLTTFACGRDLYSPLQTCADCQSYYRTWLCSVSFPRCSEPNPDTPGLLSALQPQPSGSPSRNPNFPNASYDYSALLPCIETCNAVDRACPYFLGIKCPTPRFNAGASYGIGFIDSGKPGEMGHGSTGVAQDRWGNVWCNPS